ncbi:MAG: two-component system sensor histidine kinase NtrB [Desulfovibrionales bacterium]
MLRNIFRPDPAHPFQLVKFLSWSSFLLILSTSLFLSVFIGNYARQTVLRKNHEFALLLAENLNHQIYQRFTLPTIIGFGRIQLKNQAQYDRLEKTVVTTIHSFHVLEVRIYDTEGEISFATNKDLVGNDTLSGKNVQQAATLGRVNFELLNNVGTWKSLFAFHLKPESFVLRTVYPLRAERTLGVNRPGPIIGVLEFTQDITEDYETVIYFQWLVTFISFLSSLILFLFLFAIIRRADAILFERSRERDRLERELHLNEKLATMGRMVASIAHEIRNPLGIIRSSAEILHKKAAAENSPNIRLLQAIFDESKRLSRIVNDFLDYARPKTPRLERISLDDVLDRVTTFLETEFVKQNVRLERDYPEGMMVNGDKDHLYRAFYNLITNGLQAMNGPGALRITARNEGDAWRVTVHDSGSGFDPDLTDKYLEPFFTTKDTGTGLGLAIVSNIIQSHRGTLILSNDPQGGGRATVTFPKAQP